ncbi:hypothetical protein [Streptomyces sp. NBC_01445]|uniref:hypothetical protein n=1 Tax=Streptomyces sp. NBC_01445 TaxID=2903869 RepID=UPI002DD9171D|nr:hypothetical protein [Streptomyces sp. NBC_01445]WSE08613.1 hypothetical protein OG574_37775 [Streptomyces sp. NBC_01445]
MTVVVAVMMSASRADRCGPHDRAALDQKSMVPDDLPEVTIPGITLDLPGMSLLFLPHDR